METIKHLKLSYKETEKWNEDNQTGKWDLLFDNQKFAEQIATGNLMKESEFILKDKNLFYKTIIDLKNITDKYGFMKDLYEFTFIEINGMEILLIDDTDEIVKIKDDEIVYIDEDAAGFLFSQLSSLWE